MKELHLYRTESGLWGGTYFAPRNGSFSLCTSDFVGFFAVPDDVDKVTLVFTERKRDGAYKMELEEIVDECFGEKEIYLDPMMDGNYPCLDWAAEERFKKLWKQGYNYVSCEYDD